MDVGALAARRDVRCGAVALVFVTIVLAMTLSGNDSPKAASTGPPDSTSAAQQVATRWWSNSAADRGSRVDVANPAAAANLLVPSQASYCSMLKQTLAAGRSILPAAKAGDRALVASTKAFIAELESVAPAAVSEEWKTLAPTLIALVSGEALPASGGTQATANAAAARAIGADAKANCGVTLSPTK